MLTQCPHSNYADTWRSSKQLCCCWHCYVKTVSAWFFSNIKYLDQLFKYGMYPTVDLYINRLDPSLATGLWRARPGCTPSARSTWAPRSWRMSSSGWTCRALLMHPSRWRICWRLPSIFRLLGWRSFAHHLILDHFVDNLCQDYGMTGRDGQMQ